MHVVNVNCPVMVMLWFLRCC